MNNELNLINLEYLKFYSENKITNLKQYFLNTVI